VTEYFEPWKEARDARGLCSINSDASSFKHHIKPVIGDKPIAIWPGRGVIP
jgi:hypothetical protein